MNPTLHSRFDFREKVFNRHNGTCIIPWCAKDAVDAHHIIERSLWEDGGYYLNNGASVCEHHHKAAEDNLIPPQAFWWWLNADPITPKDTPHNINKWGDTFDTPAWEEYRDFQKYPSSRHFPFSHSRDDDDTQHQSVDEFIDVPLVITIKMDGANTMIVSDTDNPVRSRAGNNAPHESYDLLKQEYWERNLYEIIPDDIQIFGEWIYAHHSIHYGCEGCCSQRNQGPPLKEYFQVFGVFNEELNLWLSWPETVEWANKIGFKTVPVITKSDPLDEALYTNSTLLYDELVETAERVVTDGHEGIVARYIYPYHYGQFPNRLGKYVRENHVKKDEIHWKHKKTTTNKIEK